MRTVSFRFSMVALLVALLGAAFLSPKATVVAQEEKIVCDSDLVLSLYTAQNFFGLGTLLEMLASAPADLELPVVDITKIEQGQYAPLFENIDSEDTLIDEETINAIAAEIAIAPSDRMTALVDPATNPLQPALITGEPAECSILRAQLNYFYTLLAEVS